MDRRPILALFLLTCLCSLGLAAPLVVDHVAAQGLSEVDVSVTDARVSDDGVALELAVTNPTVGSFTVPTTRSLDSLGLYVGDERVNLPRESTLDGATVSPGETVAVTATLTVREAYRDDAAAVVAGAELDGVVPVRIAGNDLGTDVAATVDAEVR